MHNQSYLLSNSYFSKIIILFKKGAEFLPISAIETQKTQKLGAFAEILPPVEPLLPTAKATALFKIDYLKISNCALSSCFSASMSHR